MFKFRKEISLAVVAVVVSATGNPAFSREQASINDIIRIDCDSKLKKCSIIMASDTPISERIVDVAMREKFGAVNPESVWIGGGVYDARWTSATGVLMKRLVIGCHNGKKMMRKGD